MARILPEMWPSTTWSFSSFTLNIVSRDFAWSTLVLEITDPDPEAQRSYL